MAATEIPEFGRGLVISEYGRPMEVRELPLTEPEPGSILVKIETATLCGTDIHLWNGEYAQFAQKLPLMPGHEAVGTIVAFGDGPHTDSVGTMLEVGDRIVWEHEACNHCYACNVLMRPTLCTNRRTGILTNIDAPPYLHGTIAEYNYVWPGSGRLRVPDGVKSTWASAASCAFRTVLHAIETLDQVDYRHNVVIQGAGPLGLFGTAMMSTLNPQRLIVIGAPSARLDVALAYGADQVISVTDTPDRADRVAAVKEATQGRGADVICDFSGGPGVVGEGVELAAPNGRYLLVGSIAGEPQLVSAQLIITRNLTIHGSLSAGIDSYYRAMQFLERYRDRFDWDLMVSGPRYNLDNANLAFEKMKSFEEVKAVIEPHQLVDSA